MKNRNIALVIIYSIITCGIYLLYWDYVVIEGLAKEGKNEMMPTIALFLITLFLPNIGYILFGIHGDNNINAIKAERGLPQNDNKVLWAVLGFFIPIVTIVLIQLEINKLYPEEA